MEFLGSAMNELCFTQESNRRGRLGRRKVEYDDTREYKSKNLHAERRRRQKLSDRLLALRSMVPIITNMNKATIIEDAITYIQELQQNVKLLSDQLLEMEGSSEEAVQTRSDEINAAEEMKNCGIMEDVQVTNIDRNKLWIKIILEKKRGRFTRLIEAMTYLGLELTDTNVATSKGAMLVSSCVEGSYGDTLTVEQTKDLLLEIIKSI
ncbi:hypothetical protein P3X46_020460 [Hevea brasiliensis]|uniref:BHLH domain-containing protein n=1 Tax=Hevea brasiliensis TaxID=3981 RepID=A0ABQ9LNT6_HEVBR|nr:transcription factor DYT1-like [Hevea brasiliensis]KAJ9168988.1 hypothetical protein P3X46_020460 [Hevea brasiliensis]